MVWSINEIDDVEKQCEIMNKAWECSGYILKVYNEYVK